jgi:hypothetical protein
MLEPVLAADGYTYDKHAIQVRHFEQKMYAEGRDPPLSKQV